MSIITTEELATYLKKTPDSGQAELIVASVNAEIEDQTGVYGADTEVTEVVDYAPVIWLKHDGITSISSIKRGYPGRTQELLPASSYIIEPDGRLTLGNPRYFVPGVSNNGYLEITYTYNQGDLPADLKLAALQIAARIYNGASNNNKEVTSAGVGSYRVTFKDASAGFTENVINRYKTVRL